MMFYAMKDISDTAFSSRNKNYTQEERNRAWVIQILKQMNENNEIRWQLLFETEEKNLNKES